MRIDFAKKSVPVLLSLLLASALLFSCPVLAQCTDNDGDGYYYEEDCGTERDCNDADALTYPGADEICNGYDDNCDGYFDEGCDTSCDDPVPGNLKAPVWGSVVSNPSLASMGHEYGLAFESSAEPFDIPQIYFKRLDASGWQIGSTVRVTPGAARSSKPSLIWNGSEYAIAWEDHRGESVEIYFVRVDASGNMIGSNIRVTHDDAQSLNPSLVWNGSEYAISWYDDRGGKNNIYFIKLDASGNKIGSDIKVTKVKSGSLNPCMVWTGTEYGIVWEGDGSNNSRIYFARLTSSGEKIGSTKTVTNDPAKSTNPGLVWTGEGYGVSWEDKRDDRTSSEIYFASLDASGNKISSDVRVTADDGIPSFANCLTWTGSEYGVSWKDEIEGSYIYDLYLARLDASGNRIGPEISIVRGHNSEPIYVPSKTSLLWNGKEFAVSWHRPPWIFWPGEIGAPLYFVLIKCCGNDFDMDSYGACDDCDDFDPFTYPGGTEMCNGKDNNCDGILDNKDTDMDGYIDENCIGGSDCNDNDYEIFPGAVEYCDDTDNDCDGTADEGLYLDADGDGHYHFNSCLTPNDDCNDANAFINPDILEACNSYDDDCNGLLDDGCDSICDDPIKWSGSDIRKTFTYSVSSHLIWNGSEFGMAWSDSRHGNSEIYFLRMDSSAINIGPQVRVTFDSAESGEPSLVWTGEEYGIAWIDHRDGDQEIYFARLDSTGSKIGSDIRINVGHSESPSMVWTGTEYGLTWKLGYGTVYFTRLDSSGNKIGLDRKVTSNGKDPNLVWTGNEYGVAWSVPDDDPVYFARLDPSGTKIGSDVEVTDEAVISAGGISLAWTGNEFGIVWTDWRVEDNGYYKNIYFAHLDATGSKIGSDTRISHPSPDGYQTPSLVWTGSEYGVAYGGNAKIWFARIDSSGDRIGNQMQISDYYYSGGYEPSLVWTGNDFGVAWPDYRWGDYQIYFNKIICP